MSELSDCKQSIADSVTRKRCISPHHASDQDASSAFTSRRKFTKVDATSSESPSISQNNINRQNDKTESDGVEKHIGNIKFVLAAAAAVQARQGDVSKQVNPATTSNNNNSSSGSDSHDVSIEKVQSSNQPGLADIKVGSVVDVRMECRPSTSLDQSDSAAIAAAEALASLTGGDREKSKETLCSSKKAGQERHANRARRGERESSKERSKLQKGYQAQAVAADSSTSVQSDDRENAEERLDEDVDDDDDDDDDESISGSSSTPSSYFASEQEDNDDGECAIVSVKMAPKIRQSLALLAQVQMSLDALEKKSAWLHQRLELKMSRQQRPHIDQRRSITQAIPGFWVTALLNHPHLSAHIDETDEDALSYMTDLEIESFKNKKLGYRIAFHFRHNPYFQNNTIVKEIHLGMGGSPVSFSNSILWLHGQNLTAHSEPRKTGRGVYQTFFSWFSDHSSPGRDDIALILKDDLYRDPLRYYLTPLWEPRENGGSKSAAPRAADNSNGDDCVVISDSDDDQEPDVSGRGDNEAMEEEGEEDKESDEEELQDRAADERSEEEDDGDILIDGSENSEQDARKDEEEEGSNGERDEEMNVRDLSKDQEVKGCNKVEEEEEEVDVDEEDEESVD